MHIYYPLGVFSLFLQFAYCIKGFPYHTVVVLPDMMIIAKNITELQNQIRTHLSLDEKQDLLEAIDNDIISILRAGIETQKGT